MKLDQRFINFNFNEKNEVGLKRFFWSLEMSSFLTSSLYKIFKLVFDFNLNKRYFVIFKSW